MKRQESKGHGSLNMRSIFRCMMEDGYYPIYEKSHIVFGIDENLSVLEYDGGILSIRIFFSIDEENFELFLEAANETMLQAYMVKPAVLDDMENLMFSCEFMCDSVREFRKFFPRCVERLTEAFMIHKAEMKKIILAEGVTSNAAITSEESGPGIFGSKVRKMVS